MYKYYIAPEILSACCLNALALELPAKLLLVFSSIQGFVASLTPLFLSTATSGGFEKCLSILGWWESYRNLAALVRGP